MKKLLPPLLFLLTFNAKSQDSVLVLRNGQIDTILLIPKQKVIFKLKDHLLPASLIILSGAADGLNQALQYRYEGFKKAFPKARDQFFDPSISWRNKYRNGNPADGRRFLGSKTWLVGFTDGYHFTRLLSHLFTSGAIAIKIGQKRQKWYVYVAQAAAYMIIERVGFHLVYYRF